MIENLKTKKINIDNAMLNLFYKWDPANKRIFANKTEREAVKLLLEIKPLVEWEQLIPDYFEEVYEKKFFPSNLVSYKPTELLRNYKKIKSWINRNM